LRRFISGTTHRRAFTRGRARLYAVVASAATLLATPAVAQREPDSERPGRAAKIASDIKEYVTAPLHAQRPQWVRFGAAVGAVAAAYQLDDDVREHFETEIAPAGETPDTRDAEDALPAALALGGTWLAATLGDNDAGRREALTMFQAAAFSGAAGYALKQMTGRERPYAAAENDAFGEGGDAFPSLHTTLAFAIGTVLAESGNERHRWVRRVLGYGLAVGTAYARLDHDAHWLSDTVAGAGLGIATARFMMQRRDAESERARFELVPVPNGIAVSYTVALRP
jgi:hypothetical protein